MQSKWIAPIGAALMILVSAGACYAQDDDASFYKVPVWPDPILDKAHILPPAIATSDVAAVSPAAGVTAKVSAKATPHQSACDALNPCALPSPMHS